MVQEARTLFNKLIKEIATQISNIHLPQAILGLEGETLGQIHFPKALDLQLLLQE